MTLSPGRQIVLDTVSEATWQAQVIAWATRAGWLIYHTWNSKRSPGGFPDLVLCRPPRLILAELKRRTGRPTRQQAAWLAALGLCPGVEVHLWRPTDEQIVKHALGVQA